MSRSNHTPARLKSDSNDPQEETQENNNDPKYWSRNEAGRALVYEPPPAYSFHTTDDQHEEISPRDVTTNHLDLEATDDSLYDAVLHENFFDFEENDAALVAPPTIQRLPPPFLPLLSTPRPTPDVAPFAATSLLPTENDVLCGRGEHVNRHHGNKRFHAVKDRLQHRYLLAVRRKEKKAIAKELVDTMRRDYGSRFLSYCSETNAYMEIDNKRVLEKAKQVLREVFTAELRRVKRDKYYTPKKKSPN